MTVKRIFIQDLGKGRSKLWDIVEDVELQGKEGFDVKDPESGQTNFFWKEEGTLAHRAAK